MQEGAITWKDCHSQLVVKDFGESQKLEKLENLQSNAEDVAQKANLQKIYVDLNNESGIITLEPA